MPIDSSTNTPISPQPSLSFASNAADNVSAGATSIEGVSEIRNMPDSQAMPLLSSLDRSSSQSTLPVAAYSHLAESFKNGCDDDMDHTALDAFNYSGLTILGGVDFAACKYQGANFSNTILGAVMFVGSELSGANFSGARLGGTNFSGAQLSGANFTRASFWVVNLEGANLSGANLTEVLLHWVNFANCQLDNTKISLRFEKILNEHILDNYLDHSANGDSLLKTIDSIDDRYANLKVDLIEQLLDCLEKQGVDLDLYIHNFLILVKPIFLSDERIKTFLMQKVISPMIQKGNNEPWLRMMDSECKNLLNYIDLEKDFNFIKNNGFFVQLILNSLRHEDLEAHAQVLYQRYLVTPEVAAMTKLWDFGDLSGKVDWTDINANNFILINGDLRILLSQEKLTTMLHARAGIQWDGFFLYRCTPTNELKELQAKNEGLPQLFKNEFKIFGQPYSFAQTAIKFTKFLEILNLDEAKGKATEALRDANETEEQYWFNNLVEEKAEAEAQYQGDGGYRELFFLAVAQGISQKKLTSRHHQEALAAIFEKHLQDTGDTKVLRLAPEHYQKIKQIFEFDDANPSSNAQTLFSLAAVFAKYSSSSFFGWPTNSPQILRNYAYALLHEAKIQDPGIISDKDFVEWRGKFLGLGLAFTCTSILSDYMIRLAKERFPNVIKAILPPAWH